MGERKIRDTTHQYPRMSLMSSAHVYFTERTGYVTTIPTSYKCIVITVHNYTMFSVSHLEALLNQHHSPKISQRERDSP